MSKFRAVWALAFACLLAGLAAPATAASTGCALYPASTPRTASGLGLGGTSFSATFNAGEVMTFSWNNSDTGSAIRIEKSAPFPIVDIVPATTVASGSQTYTIPTTGPYTFYFWKVTMVSGTAAFSASCAQGTPAPTVTGLAPATGLTTGGGAVVITGTDFTGATAVTFGGTPATSFTIDSATQITAIAPARPAGSADVIVTTPAGTSANTAADDYAVIVYTVPTLSEWAMIGFG